MVDDDAEALTEYSSFFEASGMWVATATQPSEAMDTVDELRPNLIVTDFGSEVAPVADFVHTLKSTVTTQDIPVIILTAPAPVVAARKEADACLTKPVAAAALLDRAQQLLDRVNTFRQRFSGTQHRTAQLVARPRRLRETTTALSLAVARKRSRDSSVKHSHDQNSKHAPKRMVRRLPYGSAV